MGDERFQRKCMDRIRSFQNDGRTILFVSHSPDQVRAICDRAVVLSDGKMIGLGPPGEAVRLFRETLLEAGDTLSISEHEPGLPPPRWSPLHLRWCRRRRHPEAAWSSTRARADRSG